MHINPDTNVYLLSGVPLDNTYEHTIYFASASAQAAYFKSKVHHSNAPEDPIQYKFTQQKYIRVQPDGENAFRALLEPHQVDNIWKVNYIMFQNDIYQHKWLYGFITGFQFLNNRTWRFTFELDVMQTFLFDYELKECWVEREHVTNDTVGLHTVPEPVDTGNYIIQSKTDSGLFDDYSVMIGYVQAEGSGSISAAYISGQFSGVFYDVQPCNSQAEAVGIGSFLAGFTKSGQNDNIVSITYVPTAFANTSQIPYQTILNAPSRPTNLDGYTPRNKKLLTFPYCCLHIHNGDGNEETLLYENFNDDNPRMQLIASTSCMPEVILYPLQYEGVVNNLNYKVGFSEFPQCAYAIDTFRAWLAMNSGSREVQLARGITGTISRGDAGLLNPTVLYGTWQNMADGVKASVNGDKPKGSQTGNVMVSSRKVDFYMECMTIKKEYARIIDDFFDKFGYAINRLRVPNRNGRPHWNYVKTKGCTIVGSLPMDVANQICKIYDKGITFWKNGSEVGNYSLDNSI